MDRKANVKGAKKVMNDPKKSFIGNLKEVALNPRSEMSLLGRSEMSLLGTDRTTRKVLDHRLTNVEDEVRGLEREKQITEFQFELTDKEISELMEVCRKLHKENEELKERVNKLEIEIYRKK